jgi:hemolysin D
MMIENKPVNPSPGMAITAEIKTGERRIISYLLSPLRGYKQGSLRER